MTWALAAAAALASIPAGLRWLRVAQREHYLAGSVTRAAWRWLTVVPVNALIGALGVIAAVSALLVHPGWGLLTAVVLACWPLGLSVRGVTSPLAWTARLRRLAVTVGLSLGGLYAAGTALGLSWVVLAALICLPGLIDLALWGLAPLEMRRGDVWVDKAAERLRSVGADVVAITGSYGKTTTKRYVAHLLSGWRRTVASPASFNNRMGLARAINENLAPGTEVFVAEMGTYRRGEIAELCRWIPPKVAAIVALGPVHLERFGTIEEILRAKSEILDRAEVGVICVDHPLLRNLAAERGATMRLIQVSGANGIVVDGVKVLDPPPGVFPANLAVALGVCLALGVEPAGVVPRVADLPVTEHRQSVTVGAGGFTIIDDTFNSNPDGARAALGTLIERVDGGRSVVVTPGMVELGPIQYEENRRLAEEIARRVDHLVVVGHTNRKALLAGAARGRASVTVVGSRAEAVEWVKANLGPGDAVLYENDLPDHYP